MNDERERQALLKVLAGVSDALKVLPGDSVWRPALLDARTLLKAQTRP